MHHIITYDDKAIRVEDSELEAVNRALDAGKDISFTDGRGRVAHGDVRRVEDAGSGEYGPHVANRPRGTMRLAARDASALPASEGGPHFWRDVLALNARRAREGKGWIGNGDIETARPACGDATAGVRA